MPTKPKEMLKLFKEAGWEVIRQKGSHITLGKGGERETIAMHNKEIPTGLEKKLLKRIRGNKK